MIPELKFSFPLKPWSRFRCDAGFLDPAYFDKYGKEHRGCDFNLTTGGDTDLGYPVSSMFPGVVTHAAVRGSWGAIVVVRADEWVRKLAMNTFERPIGALEVQYAHLHHVPLNVGDVVNAGDTVGSVGKGTYGSYLAHLHMEVRVVEFDAAEPQGGESEHRHAALNKCLDPQVVMQRLQFSDHPNTLSQKAYYVPTRILDVDHHGEPGALIHAVGDKFYIEGIDNVTRL